MELFEFRDRKAVRAEVIRTHCKSAGYDGCVCFSSGNSSRALRSLGLYTIDISPTGQLTANGWWPVDHVHRAWPHLFDATSGHLPLPLMVELARVYQASLRPIEPTYAVPTGSGETILALKIAFPDIKWVAHYSTGIKGAYYDSRSPLNMVVAALFPFIRQDHEGE